MINKNDLRYIKTEELIRSTYLKYQDSKRSLTVTRLCQLAKINKSTFYMHYSTMDVLEEQLRKETVRSVLLACPHITEVFSNTEVFVMSLVKTILESKRMLDRLFPEGSSVLVETVKDILLEIYLQEDTSEELRQKLIFGIAGAASILVNSTSKKACEATVHLLKRIME